MSEIIADYGLLADSTTGALVGKSGSIDWLCLPRFDSPACCAALLGNDANGRWLVAPRDPVEAVERHYRGNSMIIDTEFTNSSGKVVLTDAMHGRIGIRDVLRLVRGQQGRVDMHMELCLRCDYGQIVPEFVQSSDTCISASVGPDCFLLAASVPMKIEEDSTVIADFCVDSSQEVSFSISWSHSASEIPSPPDVSEALQEVAIRWHKWASKYKGDGPWSAAVLRSLLVLRALSDHATGALVAAPTTSLPEEPGGKKNWDYRYCWLRDGAFAVSALIESGFAEEAKGWHAWLLRAVGRTPEKLQIMYGLAGERRLPEASIEWLSGYENSRPVQVGNAASEQFQLDVYGEVLSLMYLARHHGIYSDQRSWNLVKGLVDQVLRDWHKPGSGLWESRSHKQQYTESKAMAWVALDRAIRSAEEFGLDGPLEQWRKSRSEIHEQVCWAGFNPVLNSFVQYYGADTLDASLLLLPLVGFLPAEDPRIVGTVAAIEKHLLRDGLVLRYLSDGEGNTDAPREGVFLACSFWLVENYVLQNRLSDAEALFLRLLELRNDLGLLSEEYDCDRKRLIGNFPQALSHIALINAAQRLTRAKLKS